MYICYFGICVVQNMTSYDICHMKNMSAILTDVMAFSWYTCSVSAAPPARKHGYLSYSQLLCGTHYATSKFLFRYMSIGIDTNFHKTNNTQSGKVNCELLWQKKKCIIYNL